MHSNKHEIEGALEALAHGDVVLARRYLGNALEAVQCMYCHGSLTDGRPSHPHYKGYVHDECATTYDGRIDYMSKHGELA